jgi:nitrogenase-associated protein
MTHLVFYEKPGCGGNAKQRALLEAAGHRLERRNLLTERWTPESLLAFLLPLPVAQWFNRAAPRVKSGELLPEQLDAGTALALLLQEPLLIRRPLMRRLDDGRCLVGFDSEEVERFVGLGNALSSESPTSLEGCAAAATRSPCHPPA